MKTFKSILIAALFLTVSNGLMAQDPAATAEISANATVLSSATLAGVSDLEFGEVEVSEVKVIAHTDTDAGQFTLRTNTATSIAFTLPANLTTTVDGQLRELLTNFDDDDYARVVGNNNTGVEQTETFNPTVSSYDLTTGLFDHANEFTIYLGGAVQASANQAAGDYTGTVTLSVTYN